MTCGAPWTRTTTGSTCWCKAVETSRLRSNASARCAKGVRMSHAASSRTRCRATVPPSARCCPASSLARVVIARTGARTRIGRRANGRGACRGCSQRVMPSVVCPRMDPWPTTADPDGICDQRRRTTQRRGIDARVGPTLPVRSGPPKGWVEPGRGTRLPDERLSLNNLTKPLMVLKIQPERIAPIRRMAALPGSGVRPDQVRAIAQAFEKLLGDGDRAGLDKNTDVLAVQPRR